MRKTILALAAATALPAAAGAVDVKPYGFVLANYTESWSRPNFADVPTLAISESNVQPPNQTISDFSARQSRLGLKVSGGQGPWSSAASGVVEADFLGLRNTGSAGLDVNASAPRLRLAYVQFKKDDQAVLFGQDWTAAFAPLNPESLEHVGIPAMTNSGNLWNRLPQLRWDADWKAGEDTVVGTKVALVRAFSADQAGRVVYGSSVTAASPGDQAGSGESSGAPAFQALVELRRKIAGRTFLAGVSGQYLRQSYTSAVGQPGSTGTPNQRVHGALGAAHLVLPLLDRLTVSGEAFYGNSDQNLNGLGLVYNDQGTIRTSLARGGWAQVQVKPVTDIRVNLMGGFESLSQTGVTSGVTTGGVYRNETLAANVIWDASADVSLSAEFGRIHTFYSGALAGDSKNLGLAAQYRF